MVHLILIAKEEVSIMKHKMCSMFCIVIHRQLNLIFCSLFYLIEQVINEMTDGGADCCFECVGMASLVHEAYACCRKVSLSLSLITNRTFVGCLSPNHFELEDASLHFRDSLWSISFTWLELWHSLSNLVPALHLSNIYQEETRQL